MAVRIWHMAEEVIQAAEAAGANPEEVSQFVLLRLAEWHAQQWGPNADLGTRLRAELNQQRDDRPNPVGARTSLSFQ